MVKLSRLKFIILIYPRVSKMSKKWIAKILLIIFNNPSMIPKIEVKGWENYHRRCLANGQSSRLPSILAKWPGVKRSVGKSIDVGLSWWKPWKPYLVDDVHAPRVYILT